MVPRKVFRTDYALREFLEKYFDQGGGGGADSLSPFYK
jgi:hypothetical protein